ncbi:DEAD/DEAH box helicase [Thalassotalea sp. PS06]|uniref:DEAD/DEAH box helicase n=1 Tax=Thalassotalea sp. PS06 TaxID=2594005 RepID=UPI001163FF6C|nr:DEAD/DEAH box helicase family protein [Thalassotalea sp. PS06]QDP01343.1 DEAD/DEAH box helicase [Thalassotalea sp. PS06]
MKLRTWQADFIQSALMKYSNGQKHFLCLATPGAGKTHASSVLTQQLFEKQMIDLVVCFSPSSIVAHDFCISLETLTGERFDGKLGAKGRSMTYQSMGYLDDDFWHLFINYRIFVIFDEIHHCSGEDLDACNVWGKHIIEYICEHASFTLSLTGTPWRSDETPIALAEYDESGKALCDFVYGLSDAIIDGVCRIPQIVVLDNDNIEVTKKGKKKEYESLKPVISSKVLSYSRFIKNDEIIHELLSLAVEKLDCIRKINPDAGGLIVAASVEHAHQIADLLYERFFEPSIVVTYEEDKPSEIIRQYRYGSGKWIISVGMISEGTNIPRLQICCHLSKIKTELYFRQILGRILRMTSSPNQDAFLFMLNDPVLVEYAERIAEDIPDQSNVVVFEGSTHGGSEADDENESKKKKRNNPPPEITLTVASSFNILSLVDNSALRYGYDNSVNIFGRFKEEFLDIGL